MTGLLGNEGDALCPAPEKPAAPQCRTTTKTPTPTARNARQKTTTQPRKTDGNPATRQAQNPKTSLGRLKLTPKTQTRQAESEGEKPNRATARQKPSLNFAQNLTQTNCQNPGKRHSHRCRTTPPQRH
ncbi:hypothetical protein [Methylovulum miyakonense]|uniref:hypothetical protein n=1 Tax=Methylovulum miyakonense TaxID=645578 RepID=UPI0003667598|nr:hypothetical protein [Methylovulum miyakonense]